MLIRYRHDRDTDLDDTNTWYRWYLYLISMIPINDIHDTDTDINDTDIDVWYQWYRFRYRLQWDNEKISFARSAKRNFLDPIPPDVITMRYHAREARSEKFFDYLREPSGQANFFYTTSASLPAERPLCTMNWDPRPGSQRSRKLPKYPPLA